MPLIHGTSNKSREKNIKTEMKDKPAKQAEAIGYSVQREAKKKKKAKSEHPNLDKYMKHKEGEE